MEAILQNRLLNGQIETLLKEVMDRGHPGDYNQALIEIGALVCVPNGDPRCLVCPLASLCKTRRSGRWKEIPFKPPKKQRKKEERTVVILDKDGQIALESVLLLVLLASLYELPIRRRKTGGKRRSKSVSASGTEDGSF